MRAAHDAIKAVDAGATVLLGGMSGSSAALDRAGRPRTERTASKLRVARGRRGYLAAVKPSSALRRGVYRLTITPANRHGLGSARLVWVTVTG